MVSKFANFNLRYYSCYVVVDARRILPDVFTAVDFTLIGCVIANYIATRGISIVFAVVFDAVVVLVYLGMVVCGGRLTAPLFSTRLLLIYSIDFVLYYMGDPVGYYCYY